MTVSNSVTHFEIYAQEPAELAEFYRQLFGWHIEKALGVDYFFIQTGPEKNGALRGGLLHRPIEGPRSWVNYVHVDSLDETLGRLHKLGGKVVHPRSAVPKTGWYAVVEDPQGNIFALFQPDPKAFPPPEPEI
jgi:predicted enzyme related to lactoylglutathione lyase